MTIHHIIGLIAKLLFAYAFFICLFGFTFILIDLFSDWYFDFKRARKDKAAKKSMTDGQSVKGGTAK